mgnify:FL=1
MNDKKYVVYQHVNPITNDVFYIGSGVLGREKQTGILQRGELYNLYIKNNNLEYYLGLSRQVRVDINILSYHNDKFSAITKECEIIKANYGKQCYKLVNTQTTFIYNNDLLTKRAKAVSEALSVKVLHIETGNVYPSVVAMAQAVGLQRVTLQKRLAKVVDYPCHRFMDKITPKYI